MAARRRALYPLLTLLILLVAWPTATQEAQGTATLTLDGQDLEAVAFVERADGTYFDPAPVARALGDTLVTSPLQDSLTVVLQNRKLIFGPGNHTLVTVPIAGGRESVEQLATAPYKDSGGIKLPVSLLERIFGEEHHLDIQWSAADSRLNLIRRKGRELVGSVELVHQYRVSTVELIFSAKPRYRVIRTPTSLEIRLISDSFKLRQPFEAGDDPLVVGVTATTTGLVIEHIAGASAAEPRLLDGVSPSLVIDFFQRVEVQPQDSAPLARQNDESRGFRTIVLDPGHGGSETGAVANGIQESTLTLQVAKLLKSRLEQKMPLRVVLTRTEDVEVPLAQRVALANQNKGDLFISLHFNSYQGARARGAETYFLSRAASDQLAARLADAENAVDGGERPSESGLELILWDLAQTHHLAESQRFAALVQQELNTTLGLPDRGVRQAPFRVLVGTQMPAVLVELGFLSNAEEAARLQDPLYIDELVGALSRAIGRFRENPASEPVVAQDEARESNEGGHR